MSSGYEEEPDDFDPEAELESMFPDTDRDDMTLDFEDE